MVTGPDDVAQHDVLRGLARVDEGLDLLAGAEDWSLSDQEVRACLAEAARVKARAHAAYLTLLAASARRDGPTRSGVKGGAETAAWLAAECRMSASRVRGDLREAQVLDPDGELRALGAELRAGNVTPEHTGIAVRALAGVPATMMRQRRDDIDEILTDHATTFAPPVTRDLARQLLVTLDPDRADHFDTEAHLRRELRMGTDSTGMWDVRGRLDPACGAAFKAAIDHLGAPHRGPAQGETGQAEIDVTDRRTPAQRNHDALAELVRLATGNLDAGVRAGEGPRVVVHTTAEQLAAAGAGASAFLKAPPGAATCEQSGPITPATLARLACDAVIERVLLSEVGKVLKLETLGRFFTAAQRRALAARDGGCAWPGVRPAALMDGCPRRDLLDARWPYHRRQRRPALRTAPHRDPLRRVDHRDARRRPGVHPARPHRPSATAGTQHRPRRHRRHPQGRSAAPPQPAPPAPARADLSQPSQPPSWLSR